MEVGGPTLCVWCETVGHRDETSDGGRSCPCGLAPSSIAGGFVADRKEGKGVGDSLREQGEELFTLVTSV